MIGFSQDLQLYKLLDDEDTDTKNLDKNELYELYELVTKDYMLPPINSKGITREYLLQVKEGEVFRVTHRDHKEFEYTLDKDQQKKVGVVNNALHVRKLNMLLKQHGEKELGFTEFNLPDQNWLYKVARYIDRTNMLEFFERAAFLEPPLTEHLNILSQTHHGRVYASEWLFRLEKAKKFNAEILAHELAETKNKIQQSDSDLHDLIGKVSFTYTSIENPSITPELVISGGSGLTAEMRDQLNTNSQLYSLLT